MVDRSVRAAVPVWPPRLLGAVRVGFGPGDARPRGRDRPPSAPRGPSRRRRPAGRARRTRAGRGPRRRRRGARGDRRLLPVGGARAGEPHQRARPGAVRARRRARRRRRTSTSSRSGDGSANCCTSRICGRCPRIEFARWGPLAGAVGAALLPRTRRGPTSSHGRASVGDVVRPGLVDLAPGGGPVAHALAGGVLLGLQRLVDVEEVLDLLDELMGES